MAPNAAEIICELGGCDRIVGVSKFCLYPPTLRGRRRVGGFFDPDLERIVGLRPDLVVLRGRSDPIERLCHDHGIDLYYDQTDTLAGIEKAIRDLGEKLQLPREAAAAVRRFQERIQAVKERVAGRPKPRVLLTLSRQPDRLANVLTAGRGTFLNEMVDIAGGLNVFGHLDMRYPQVSAEAIVARRPEVIIELMPEVKLTPTLRRHMLDQWRRVGPIPAAKTGRLFFLTDDHSLIPSPRYVKIVEKVSWMLHPQEASAP